MTHHTPEEREANATGHPSVLGHPLTFTRWPNWNESGRRSHRTEVLGGRTVLAFDPRCPVCSRPPEEGRRAA